MTAPPFVLVAGHWLGSWAWDEVVLRLEAAGHPATPLTLPGLSSVHTDRRDVRLADHVEQVLAAVHAAGPDVVLVAHSGAGRTVSAVLDQAPAAVSRVVYVDSWPASDGAVEELPPEMVELPLPEWEQLEGSVEGLDEHQLAEFRRRAVPHPARVLTDPLRLSDERRHRVPTTLVACSFPASTVAELAASGHPMFAALTDLTDLGYVDLPTGHWPMWSRPEALAEVLLAAG
jgi:pimeloyl-ACP methyl ester carboxylesterase